MHRRIQTRGADKQGPIDAEEVKKRTDSGRIGWIGFTSMVMLYLLCITGVHYCYTYLPPPKDHSATDREFSEARARDTLTDMLKFGIRTVGSRANEEQTPALLLKKIHAIKTAATEKIAFDIDIQHPTGSFGLNFLSQFQNIYANITNILVRITPIHPQAQNNSLLISSHYDTAPGAPGASDDGVSIAIMMELLRYFSKTPPKYASLIFNFNGAEETILQASHGFITQHRWKDSIRAFINLEAAGAGGRELLFQTGSDLLAEAYSKGAKYPHASTVAQEVFQTGLFPSDTDYRIYRDYGDVAGMDFAYIANGYVYHTRLDDIDRIQPGSIQRLGDNLVGTIHELLDHPDIIPSISTHSGSEDSLHFDVLGSFMVSYRFSTNKILCIVVSGLVMVYMAMSGLSMTHRLRGIYQVVGMWIGGIVGTTVSAVFLSVFAPLVWYSQPGYLVFYYLFPFLTGYFVPLQLFGDYRMSIRQMEHSAFEAVLLGWCCFTAVLTFYGFGASYVGVMWMTLPSMGHIIARKLTSGYRYMIILSLSMVIPIVHSMQLMAIGAQFFIPVMGRSGTTVPPDLIISTVFSLFVLVLMSYCSALLIFIKPKVVKKLQLFLLLGWIVALGIAPHINPYKENAPKRVYLQHVVRNFSSEGIVDSGLWASGIDFRGNAPLQPHWEALEGYSKAMRPPAKDPVDYEVYGNFPWYLPVKHMLPRRNTWYIPASIPVIPSSEEPVDLQVVKSQIDEQSQRRKIHLKLTGPAHMTMYIDAKETQLTSWSIGNGTDAVPPAAKDSYFLYFATGQPPGAFHFWLETKDTTPLRIAYAGHYLGATSTELRTAIKALPNYMNPVYSITSWTCRKV